MTSRGSSTLENYEKNKSQRRLQVAMSIELRNLAKVDLSGTSADMKALILGMYSYTSKNGESFCNYLYRDNIAYLPPGMDKLKVVANVLGKEIVDGRSKGSPIGSPFLLNPTFSLREYQVQPAKDLIDHAKLHNYSTLAAPTGAGKTCVLTYTYGHLGLKTLIVVDQSNLQPSWMDAAKFVWNRDIQVVKSGTTAFGDINIATLQLLARSDELLYIMRNEFGTLVFDESHISAAPSYKKVLSSLNNFHRLSCSASFFKKGLPTQILEDFLAPVSVKMENKQALIPEIRWVDTNVAWCSNDPMEYANKILPALAKDQHRNAVVFNVLKQCFKDNRTTAVVAITVEQAKWFDVLVKKLGARSIVYTGVTSLKRDMEVRDLVANKEVDFVMTVGKITKGTDWPNLDSIVIVKPDNSERNAIQVVGRVSRVVEGKRTPWAWDFRDKGDLADVFSRNRNKYYVKTGYTIKEEI